jgi:hypothetical protein
VASRTVPLERLRELLGKGANTRGLEVTERQGSWVLSRRERVGPGTRRELVPRVRLTPLGGAGYGLSVFRHTERWEKTPYVGSPEELVSLLDGELGFLVAEWP